MNTGGWELRLNTESSTEKLIYSNVEGRKKERVFVRTRHNSEVVSLVSTVCFLCCCTALGHSDALHDINRQKFLPSRHGLILHLD